MSMTSSVVEVAIAPSSSSTTTSKSSVLETIKEQRRSKRCVFCNRWTVNELTLGPLYTRDGVICHYFCVLFCSNLRQNGEKDTDGILGFLTQDIQKEVKRVKGSKNSRNYNFYKCRFCKQPGATIGCFVKKCRMVYHFPCGLLNGVKYKFTSDFESYCKAHGGPKVFKPIILRDCAVCAESLDEEDCAKPIVLGRCCSNSNLHRECMQYYALSAGSHHLKCPTCADKELFITDVKSQGVFVPEKDAEWETESPDAYHELRQRYSRCDAPECLCPKGRDRYDKDLESLWLLVRCNSCASSSVHVNCENLANLDYDRTPPRWLCPICREVEIRLRYMNNRLKNGIPAVLPNARVGDEIPGNVGVVDGPPANIGVVNGLSPNVGVANGVPASIGVVNELPANVGVFDGPPANIGIVNGLPANVGDVNGLPTNIGVVNEIPANVGVVDEIPEKLGVGDEIQVAFEVGDEIPTSVEVGDEIQMTVGVGGEISAKVGIGDEIPIKVGVGVTCPTDEEESDDLSVSSGGTLFSIVKKQPSEHNSQQEMQSSPMHSGIDEPTVNVSMHSIKKEDEEGSQCPNPVLSLSGSDVDEDARSDVSARSPCSSDSNLSLFIPVEPPRKKRKLSINEVTLPAFKIKAEGNDVKKIRCYCERHTDEEPLIQCRRCSIWFHKRCSAGLYEIYGKTLQTRCCKICTDLPALKGLQEIPLPLSGLCIPKGCENTRGKTYYLTLVSRAGAGAEEFMVRRHDALYISEKGNRDVESSRILRVEKLWKNNQGSRFISGHFYFRPSETANADTRRFYRKEIFRASTTTNAAIQMENVLGRCWILDPVTYCRGRPSGTTLDDEKHVFICESWVDPQTHRISMIELAQSIHSICMRPDAFKEFASEMKIKKDYRVEGLPVGKQGSSSGSSLAPVLDNSIVVLDSDSD